MFAADTFAKHVIAREIEMNRTSNGKAIRGVLKNLTDIQR